MDALFKAGANCGVIDPVTIVSAMAAVTESVSFGITGSTSYIGKILFLSVIPVLILCLHISYQIRVPGSCTQRY
jgi:hypothetical protein